MRSKVGASAEDGMRGTVQARRTLRASTAAAVVRRPVVKAYGAWAVYGETKYERERRQRREYRDGVA